MIQKQRGFTIVELLIVIIVIGILTGISATVWVSAGIGARDSARENDARTWAGTYEVYRSRFGVYPVLPTADGAAGAQYVCLGSFSTTGNKCVQYNSGSASKYIDATASATTTMLANIAKVGSVPANGGPTVATKLAGPFLWISQATNGGTGAITDTAYFINFFETNCPSGFTDLTASADPTLAALFAGISNTKACGLQKTYTYTPS